MENIPELAPAKRLMRLSDYTLPVQYAECKDLALVYPYEVAVQWYAIQQEHGDPRHVGVGLPLSDGRWMMYAEVLSEMYPGGIIGWAVEYLTPEFMATVEVIPLADALALLPPESSSPVI
jgi:hypothetical protein